MGVGRGFAHRTTRVPLFTIRSSATSASGLGWVRRAGVRCTAWIQGAGVARTARTTVGQASSSWSARCSRIVLNYRIAAMSAARHHIATSPALPAAARPASDIDVFVATLGTHRDRAMLLACCWVGCARRRCAACGWRIDMGRRRLRVIGKGGKERHVPVDPAFFTEVSAYLRWERPPASATPQCFVVLRCPTTCTPVSETGPRSIPAIRVASFGDGLAAPDLIRGSAMCTFSPSSRESPVCSANVITGTSPAYDTRCSSSNTAEATAKLWDTCTDSAFLNWVVAA